jgi:hypothetical protein
MCIFNICEFYNLIISAIVGGIIGLIMVIIYERLVNRRKMKEWENYFIPLESKDENTFDWICYDIKGRENSRENGSLANIKYIKGSQLEIRVKEPGGNIWLGQITMTDHARGSLTFNYIGKYEYGFKDCYLGQELDDRRKFDYWILVGDGKVYFNELIRRERK